MTTRRLLNCLMLVAILAVGLMASAQLAAQTGSAAKTQEYFVQQAAGEDLLITINGFEAEFESQIIGQEGETLLLSGIPGSRIVPVFQYINAPDKARQLDIAVTSGLYTARSEFGLELTRLAVWDERSRAVSRAYQLLSFGMQASKVTSQANWTVKIDSLVNAGRLFQRFGMKEMRLWSNYLAAHLIQFHLHDHSIVYSMTREILADLKGTRLTKVELATLQLQSIALIGLQKSAPMRISANDPDPVQSALSLTARRANAMGYSFEQARALYASGVEYAAGALYEQALEQFQKAVQIADSVGDAELATGIRDSIVQIHAIQGNTPATSEVLQEIETQLVEDGGGDELALNLLAQGRLLIRSYRYDQAYEVLYQALDHENNSAIRRQVNFELARVFYETGRMDESLAYLRLADVKPVAGSRKRRNTVVNVGEGLRIRANIHRARAEFDEMRKARSAQAQYQPASANYLYEQGLDELARAGKNRQRARSLFRQSQAAAATSGQVDLQHRSSLQFCALGGSTDGLCSKASVRASYQWLLTSGVPVFTAQAMFSWAKILVLNGRQTEAVTILDRLTDEIHLLRHSLSGVLGAWYWEERERLFEYYLDMLIKTSGQRGRADGSASLLALSKIRYIEKSAGSNPASNGGSGDTELLRVQIAQRANSAPGQIMPGLNDKINRGLDTIRAPFRKKFEFLSNTGLQKYLRSLGNDELVMTYHISPTTAQVWVGRKGKVQQRNIANPASLYATLQEQRQGLAYIGGATFKRKMDALGKRLVDPVADLLSGTVYWIPAGPLLGFPLDALRLKGRYLAENHMVVNMMSFPANPGPGASLEAGPLQSVFLAGHPRDYSSDYAVNLDTSREIEAIADIFVGPGLRIVQGVALLPDEFEDERFRQANLVHLSMPGLIDLKYAELSALELSGSEDSPGRLSLRPKDIRSQKMDAGLVFLSAIKLTQEPSSAFTANLGLVADFIDAGAHSVIVNLWATDGEVSDAFLSDFFHELEASGNIANSLTNAKRQYLKSSRDNSSHDWAGYQIYIK